MTVTDVLAPDQPSIAAVDVALTGTFDASAALALRQNITEAAAAGPVIVLLDVADVTNVNPSGVAALIDLLRYVRARGGDVRLYGDSPALREAHAVMRLDSITRIYRTHWEAAHGDLRCTPTVRDSTRGSVRRHRRKVTGRGGWRGHFGRRPQIVQSS